MNVALREVLYKNTSDAPNVTARVVNVTVEDISMALEGGLLTLTTASLNATDIDDAQATLDFVVTTAPTKAAPSARWNLRKPLAKSS